MKILKFLGIQPRNKVTIPIVGFSSDMLKLYFYQGILKYDVFIQFSLFSFILGTKTHWIFWRAPEHGSSIRARFSFLFQIARSKYQ